MAEASEQSVEEAGRTREIDPLVKEWEKRLWDLANAITGFTLAQSLLSAYKFGDDSFRSNFKTACMIYGIIAALAIVTGLELFAVAYCRSAALKLLRGGDAAQEALSRELWIGVTRGRFAAVVLFALAPLAGLLGILWQIHG
ncbi:MAG: hypothetical protein QOC81_374 [Thermoanaerobaculia bacterium]|jgi:hypothetical protein|nr:hypothetical protein [Thermoanaerobaculia bacterium]